MPGQANLSDGQIVQQVLAGDSAAFGTLVERHLAVVHGLAYAHAGNRSDAEDIAQETFVRAFQSLDTLRDPRKFVPWLAGITRNVCSGFKRARLREQETAHRAAREQSTATPDLGSAEIHAAVRTELNQLDYADREILLLHYFAGKTTREIAEILGVSRHAAKKRLERARNRLATVTIQALHDALDPPASADDRRKKVMAAVAMCEVRWRSAAPLSPAIPLQSAAGFATLVQDYGMAALLLAAVSSLFIFLEFREPNPVVPGTDSLDDSSQRPDPPQPVVALLSGFDTADLEVPVKSTQIGRASCRERV